MMRGRELVQKYQHQYIQQLDDDELELAEKMYNARQKMSRMKTTTNINNMLFHKKSAFMAK